VTLALLLLWVIVEQQRKGEALLTEVLLTVLVLVSIALHEIGHALAAKYFGVKTHEIILYPFGGVARIAKEFTEWKELIVAAAGPLTSAAIALVLHLIPVNAEMSASVVNLHQSLRGINIILCLFNLIPAYPMDGGRILKAILELLQIKSATSIATSLGQVVSILMGCLGFYYQNPILVLVSIVVFFAAMSERARVQEFHLADKTPITKVMTTLDALTIISHGTTTKEAIDKIVTVQDSFFPVLYGTQLVGIIEREFMLSLAGTAGEDEYLATYVIKDFPTITADATAALGLGLLDEHKTPLLIVKSGEDFKGLVFLTNVVESLYIGEARANRKPTTEDDDWDI
jgi:stage IV sporulation protein FB